MTKEEILIRGAEKYGTPLYIFDTDQAAEQVKSFRKILGEKAGLCYAMKANPFLVKQMAGLTDRVEVCSMGEFYICREMGIPGEKLFISGVVKKKEDIWKNPSVSFPLWRSGARRTKSRFLFISGLRGTVSSAWRKKPYASLSETEMSGLM